MTTTAEKVNAWSYCTPHGKRERIPSDGAYRVCLECGHVYLTGSALVAAWNAAVDEINSHDFDPPARHETDPERIWFCQVCLHDF